MAEFLGSSAQGNYYYLLALIAAIVILILFKEYRKQFLVFIVLGIVIANPWFKDLWTNKLHLLYYWRILWIVPVVPLCAALPAMLAERVDRKVYKGLIAIGFAVLYILTGSMVYQNEHCTFQFPAANASKLPEADERLAVKLLQMEEYPRVVADRRVASSLREYDGKIHTLYARDAFGYICGMNETAAMVDQEINKQEDGDMALVAQKMKENDYHFLISAITVDERLRRLEEAGFRKVFSVSHWGIFELVCEDNE